MDFTIFDRVMKYIIKTYKYQNSIANSLRNCLGINVYENIYKYDFLDSLIYLLENIMDDKNKWIEYFIYECECTPFDIQIDDKIYMVGGNKDLYDLITTGIGGQIRETKNVVNKCGETY